MPLTQADYWNLANPFELHEHAIKPKKQGSTDGYAYIQKAAIIRRLNRYAPGNWHTGEPTLIADTNGVVVMSAKLIIYDQYHSGVGTGSYMVTKSDGTQKGGYEVATEVTKAYKAAASDCFPRAALMFSIGWYLHPIAPNWKDRVINMEGLRAYLHEVKAVIDKARGDADSAREALGNTGPRRLT